MPRTAVDFRRYPRLTVDLPALRRVGQQFVEERVVNISQQGLALATRSLLEPGAPVHLFVSSRDGRLEFPVRGKVVYARTHSDESPYLAGVRLGQMDARTSAAYEQLLMGILREPDGRRSQPRVEVHAEALWHRRGDSSPPKSVTLVNISFNGALLLGPAAPRQGQRGELTLVSPVDGRMAGIDAVAVWSRSSPSEDLAGVRFDDQIESQRFIADALRGFLLSPRRAPTPAAKPPGIRIGDFELGPLIGQGGRCDVYRGKGLAGPLAGRDVALKHLRPELAGRAAAANAFLLQADLGRMLAIPGLVAVHSAISLGEELWMVEELVDGLPLGQLLARIAQASRRPPVEAVVSVTIEVLRALDALHRARTVSGKALNLVHGNVTPGHVLISRGGEVKLTSRCTGRVGKKVEPPEEGALPYAAPEMLIDGEAVGPQVDVYQAAVLLYEALTGVAPFRGDTRGELAEAIRRGPIPPSRLNPELPRELDRAVLLGLQLSPARRPPGAGAFAERLESTGCVPARDPAAARRRLHGTGGRS